MSRKQIREKLIREGLGKVREERKTKMKILENQTDIEVLEGEINDLKNTVFMCEYDLKNPTLIDNSRIILKLNTAKQNLERKKRELEDKKKGNSKPLD